MEQLIKQTKIYEILKSAKQSGSLSHAYLINLDDEKILKDFLKELSLVFFDENFTLKERIENETFSDILFFPKDGAKFLVEDAERIVEESAIMPVEGDIKLFVITDLSKATPQSQNKLLKVIEEPPKGVYFLFGASNLFSILPTVLSRVKTLDVPPFSAEQVTEYFQRNVFFKENQKPFVRPCAALCMGKIGSTEKLVLSGDYQPLISCCQSLLLCEKDELPVLVKKVGEPSFKGLIFSTLSIIFKDALLIKKGIENTSLKEEEFWIKKVANKFSFNTLLFAFECILNAEKELFFHSSFSMTLETCLLKIFNH